MSSSRLAEDDDDSDDVWEDAKSDFGSSNVDEEDHVETLATEFEEQPRGAHFASISSLGTMLRTAI
jgi:hypothetical protein